MITVVIPCCNEPALLRSLASLWRCRLPDCSVEVVVVVNHADNAPVAVKQQNAATLRELQEWTDARRGEGLTLHVMYRPDLPPKIAGVGYARKTGMDDAACRQRAAGVYGVIAGFDADALCDDNYFEALAAAFSDRRVNGASIYFEHPLEGDEYAPAVYKGIALYELHLRCLNQSLRHAGFPYACHTVGSSFAVRASVYLKQGGMNRRKAGEDFYFLHKIMPLGGYIEINNTRVVPSPRPSDRVPFGTGASISRWLDAGSVAIDTYPLAPFNDLRQLFALVPSLFKASANDVEQACRSLASPLREYLTANDCVMHIRQASENSASPSIFARRFFVWFDGLRVVKYLNASCRDVYPKQPPTQAAAILLQQTGGDGQAKSATELLKIFRKIERSTVNYPQTVHF